jgi:hypothetical protein
LFDLDSSLPFQRVYEPTAPLMVVDEEGELCYPRSIF